jgi:nicotinamidase-related amidase
MSAGGPTPPWLAVIDMQEIFGAPDSPWAAPGFAGTVAPVNRLVAAAGSRVTFTRFVAPAQPEGAWVDYYRQWPFALQPPDAPTYRLVDEVDHRGRGVLDATTFSKWPALADVVRPGGLTGGLVLAGVATDCCVVSTALAAADAGVRVLVVAEACAGADDEAHERALALMAAYAPLIEVVGLDAALSQLSA